MGSSSSNVCSPNYNNSDHGFLIFTPGASTIVIGATRILAMMCFLLYNYRNKMLLQLKGVNSIKIVRGLVLPSYYPVVYSLIAVDLTFAIVDICLNIRDLSIQYERNIYMWMLPVQFALFHTIYEGITIFMMKYGAGVKAFQESLTIALIWGVVTFLLIFYAMCYFESFDGLNDTENYNAVYFIFLAYNILLCAFYLIVWLAPVDLIYMRPALKKYAGYNVAIYVYWICFSSIIHFSGETGWTCASSIFAVLLVGFLQPYAIWTLLQGDSQYWQGLTPDSNNPLKEVWDQVDVETATTMGDGLSHLTDNKNTEKGKAVPLLHFGLITMNKEIGFVAGGFSRVYFGVLKKEKVALKIMFAMELTPSAVLEFYEEAKMLHLLKNDLVVGCKGVCVMPPAVAIVLEYCRYGSLFDFMYKPRTANDQGYVEVDPSSIGVTRGVATEGSGHNNEEVTDGYVLSQSNIIRNTDFVLNPVTANMTLAQAQAHAKGNIALENNVFTLGNEDSTKTPRTSKDNLWSTFIETPPPKVGGGGERRSYVFGTSKGGDNNRNSAGDSNNDESGAFSFRSSLDSLKRMLPGALQTVQQLPPFASSVPISIRYSMALDVAAAIEFLHSKGYMHCDIKSLNFLVSESYRIKLTDFGEARHVDQPPKRNRPPIPAINWAPPEVLSPFANPYSYTQRSDVFSTAIVISELLTLELPYGTECDKVSADTWYHKLSSEKVRPNIPSGMPIQLKEAIEGAWASNQLERPVSQEFNRQLRDIEICRFFGISDKGKSSVGNRSSSSSNIPSEYKQSSSFFNQSIHNQTISSRLISGGAAGGGYIPPNPSK